MMSLALRPAIANTGKAQNGCSKLVHASPQATAIATRGISTPKASALAITTGLWTAHCPPPDGTNILTIPALIKVQSAKVLSVANEISQSEMLAANPE